MAYFVGIDVGGTTSTISVCDDAKQVLHMSDQFATLASEGPESTIAAIVEQVFAGLSHVAAELGAIRGVGLSTPGPATLDGILLKTPNLDAKLWDRYPIRGELEAALRKRSVETKVHYIGDGQAAALGEFSIRAGQVQWSQVSQSPDDHLQSLFMVIVGTGLGGGEVRDRQVVRGREGRAGHVGHLLLPHYAFRYEHDRHLTVGNAECTVESAVSLTALSHQLAHRLTLPDWRDHPLNKQAGSNRDKAKQLRNLADVGDKLALEMFDDQAKALGIGLLNVNYLGDYDVVVIGGGVCDLSSQVRDRYRRVAEETYRRYALDGFRNLEQFEFSVCGDEAPVIGALAHAAAASD